MMKTCLFLFNNFWEKKIISPSLTCIRSSYRYFFGFAILPHPASWHQKTFNNNRALRNWARITPLKARIMQLLTCWCKYEQLYAARRYFNYITTFLNNLKEWEIVDSFDFQIHLNTLIYCFIERQVV